MTALINKKLILTGILVILISMIIIPFFFKVRTTGKVISGGSTTCHCMEMSSDGTIDYNQKKDMFINCTVEYTTWYGSTCTFRCDRTVEMPYSQMIFFHPGDPIEVEYNPLFPGSAEIAGLP